MSSEDIKPVSSEELRRLSLVRHLYELGVQQSRGAEPTASLSILPFHDAAESFLQLVCERYDAGENKADFMRYWELLALKGIVVPQRETMRRLNAARRGLKHQGVLPAQVELEGFRSAITNLLYDSSSTLFNVDFDRISLVQLISDPATREMLEGAYVALSEHNHAEALSRAAIGFVLLHNAHTRSLSDSDSVQRLRSLRETISPSPFSRFALRDIEQALGREVGRAFERMFDDHDRTLRRLGEVVELLSYGGDLQAYIVFKANTPIVHQLVNGSPRTDWMHEPTKDQRVVASCLNFVVNAAIKFGV